MADPALLLVTDGRWPLDADAARVAREMELGTGAPVTALRVPADPSLYALAPPGDGAVVVVVAPGTEPLVPPVGWTRAVCWHAAGGCSPAWRDGEEAPTDTIQAFVAPEEEEALAMAATGFAIVGAMCTGTAGLTVLVLLGLMHRRRAIRQ